jgi:hypothetical protein
MHDDARVPSKKNRSSSGNFRLATNTKHTVFSAPTTIRRKCLPLTASLWHGLVSAEESRQICASRVQYVTLIRVPWQAEFNFLFLPAEHRYSRGAGPVRQMSSRAAVKPASVNLVFFLLTLRSPKRFN